ncbi:hypothetical protein HMPREF1544_05352, partial [Mucor circinelloides 1006PhL]
ENIYHFVVGCRVKSCFWQDVVSLLSLQGLLPSSDDLKMTDEDVLVVLGAAYSTL